MTDSSPPSPPIATGADDASAPASTAPIEHWERDLDVPAWLCVLVRVLHRWPAGRVLTRDEYAAGLETARALTLG
jgi:hypothetical protein